MRNFYKKTLMCLTALAMASSAFADTFKVNDITYDGNDGVATVSKVPTTKEGEVVIPATVTYNGAEYTVNEIGPKAFYTCHSLTSVILPNTIKTIGKDAFYYCVGLTSIDLPKSLTTIGENAFLFCGKITDITIPESVTSIGKGAFCNNFSLTSITLSPNIKRIESSTFEYCNLTSITIPEGITYIGEDAFYGCI